MRRGRGLGGEHPLVALWLVGMPAGNMGMLMAAVKCLLRKAHVPQPCGDQRWCINAVTPETQW